MFLDTRPTWREENGSYFYTLRERIGLKAFLIPEIKDEDGEVWYSIHVSGPAGQFSLHDSDGAETVATLEIAKRHLANMVIHPVYEARAMGRTIMFEKCPVCRTLQRVSVNVETAELTCLICEKEFRISEP